MLRKRRHRHRRWHRHRWSAETYLRQNDRRRTGKHADTFSSTYGDCGRKVESEDTMSLVCHRSCELFASKVKYTAKKKQQVK